MKFSDLKLRNRLILGFGIIIISITILEYNNLSEVNRIAGISEMIYEHPFTVSNSVRDIKIDINAMHRWMKDIVLADNEEEIEKIAKVVDECEAHSLAKFDTVFKYFLGDPEDVRNAYEVFTAWKEIRDEVIMLMRNGRRNEAIAITKGKGMDHINLVNEKADSMIAYANYKVGSFNEEAMAIRESVYKNVLIVTTSILILSIIIAILITGSITKPINKIIGNIKRISKDQFHSEIAAPGANHLTILENSVSQLEVQSKALADEIMQRKLAQAELENYQARLEELVAQRTAELNETKQLLFNAFDGAAIGMVLIKPGGKFFWTNTAFCEIVGYTDSELKDFAFNDITHPEDYQIGNEIVKKLISGESNKGEIIKRYIHKNGNTIVVKLTISLIRDKDENPSYLFTQVQDITAQKEAEKQIKEYSNNLEQMVKERTLEIEEKSRNVQESQKALAFLLEDVNESRTELEAANKKLETANKELESFSYSVSHDLRAPLRAIDGFSRMLYENCSESLDDEGKRLLNTIRSNTKKMGLLIDDLLAFSRLGRKKIERSQINMVELTREIRGELTTLDKERKIKILIDELPTAYGDRSLIRQVVFNLFSNALKFSKSSDPAIIKVGYNEEEDQTIYYIQDNGVGFNMQYANKLFNVFQRLHSEQEFEGTGVGLAIVQRIRVPAK